MGEKECEIIQIILVYKCAYFHEMEFFHECFKIIVYGILYVKFKLNFSMILKSKKSLIVPIYWCFLSNSSRFRRWRANEICWKHHRFCIVSVFVLRFLWRAIVKTLIIIIINEAVGPQLTNEATASSCTGSPAPERSWRGAAVLHCAYSL